MLNNKISALVALSLVSLPYSLPATPDRVETSSQITTVSPSQKSAIRRMKHQTAPAAVLEPMGRPVGELQEKWKFPSDHLAIGMTFEGLHFMSWNVLDGEYMDWVLEKDSQGLKRSLIADEHVYIGNSKLTVRDQHVASLVLEAINHPTHPRSIICLQECSKPFIDELRARLPDHFEIVSCHGESVLVDLHQFEILEAKEVSGLFSNEPHRSVQELFIRSLSNGQVSRLVNVHLPGDPAKPGRFEFANYLSRSFDPDVSTIAMGDMNFNELEMADALSQAFQTKSPYSLYSPYCTNISPFILNSKAIDHFLVYSPNSSPVELSLPDQIMPELGLVADLLQGNGRPILPADTNSASR